MSDGAPIYHYINDGDRLGNLRGAGTYTGKVNDFTRELSTENQMIVSIDQQADLDRLVDQFIYVNNDGAETGAYRIFNAERIDVYKRQVEGYAASQRIFGKGRLYRNL